MIFAELTFMPVKIENILIYMSKRFSLMILKKNSRLAVAAPQAATTTSESCSQILTQDKALVACNSLNIIDLTQLVNLCVQDYNSAPVGSNKKLLLIDFKTK